MGSEAPSTTPKLLHFVRDPRTHIIYHYLLLLLLMLYNTQMYIDGPPTTNAGSQKNINKWLTYKN